MTNPFIKKNADDLLEGVSEGDVIVITWFLNSAALGGPTEMGPLAFKVLALDGSWINLRSVDRGASLRIPVSALRSVRREG